MGLKMYRVCYFCSLCFFVLFFFHARGRRGRDRMVVGFTIAHVISAYHH
jgi:hypothetical protein